MKPFNQTPEQIVTTTYSAYFIIPFVRYFPKALVQKILDHPAGSLCAHLMPRILPEVLAFRLSGTPMSNFTRPNAKLYHHDARSTALFLTKLLNDSHVGAAGKEALKPLLETDFATLDSWIKQTFEDGTQYLMKMIKSNHNTEDGYFAFNFEAELDRSIYKVVKQYKDVSEDERRLLFGLPERIFEECIKLYTSIMPELPATKFKNSIENMAMAQATDHEPSYELLEMYIGFMLGHVLSFFMGKTNIEAIKILTNAVFDYDGFIKKIEENNVVYPLGMLADSFKQSTQSTAADPYTKALFYKLVVALKNGIEKDVEYGEKIITNVRPSPDDFIIEYS